MTEQLPRFRVISVTGYAITPGTHGVEGKLVVRWSVLDAAVCFREVTQVKMYGERGEQAARKLAAALERVAV